MAPCQLEHERSAPLLCGELKEDQPVIPDLLDLSQLCSSEVIYQALIEGAFWSCVARDPLVLKMQPAGLSLAGEIDAQDRRVGSLRSRNKGEDRITRGPRLYITQGGAVEEPAELLD